MSSLPGTVQYRVAAGGAVLPAYSECSVCPQCGWRGLISICAVSGWPCFLKRCDDTPCDQRRSCTKCRHQWTERTVSLPDMEEWT